MDQFENQEIIDKYEEEIRYEDWSENKKRNFRKGIKRIHDYVEGNIK